MLLGPFLLHQFLSSWYLFGFILSVVVVVLGVRHCQLRKKRQPAVSYSVKGGL